MSKQKLKQDFRRIFMEYAELGNDEIWRVFENAYVDRMKEAGWDESEKGKSWNDEQLRVILSDAPTKLNCLKYARAFKRGYGSIEQIYRWASTSQTDIESKGRGGHSFVQQIKRIAAEVQWKGR